MLAEGQDVLAVGKLLLGLPALESEYLVEFHLSDFSFLLMHSGRQW